MNEIDTPIMKLTEGEPDDKPGYRKYRNNTWRRKWLRPKQYKIADEVTLQRIVNPPPRPDPEFQGEDYVVGINDKVEYIFQCGEPDCGAKFTSELSLNIHATKHLSRRIKCKFCKRIFKTEQYLAEHCTTFHPDLDKDPDANPLQCQSCGKCTRDVKALWRHIRETHRDTVYPCPQCDLVFKLPDSMKEHLKIKHPENGQIKLHTCKICDKQYALKGSLLCHIRDHHRGTSQETYRCVLCNTMYSGRKTYYRHMRGHVAPKFFPCQLCNLTFRSASHLKRHEESVKHIVMTRKKKKKDSFSVPVIKTVTTAKNPNLTKEELIQLCRKTAVKIILHRVDSTYKASKRIVPNIKISGRHVRLKNPKIDCKQRRGRGRPRKYVAPSPPHSSPPPTLEDNRYQYKLWGNDTSNLQMPVLIPESPVPPDPANEYLDCIYCDKSLPNLDAVKVHEKLCYFKMRNKKVFICPLCNKEFDVKYKFQTHFRLHGTERPFQCAYCDATFKINATKVQHEKAVHFGIRYKPKPQIYKCNYENCDMQFNNPKCLRRHVSAEHLGVRFTCEKCGRVYRRGEQYRKHLKRDHAECPVRLECKPCERTYKGRLTYLAHLKTSMHSWRSRQYKRRENMRKIYEKKTSAETADVPEVKSPETENKAVTD